MKQKSKYLLDAGIFPLILAGDPNVKPLVEEIASGKAEPMACEVNLAEFYAKTCEKMGREVAETYYLRIRCQPKMTIIAPNEEMTRSAGMLKCKYRGNVSLADCYAAASALLCKATLITTDTNLHKMATSEKIPTKIIPLTS
ncbi:MAG: PIN domain-containing protein [Candidatus Bathyarchaeia archaeon]